MAYFQAMADKNGKFKGFISANTQSHLEFKLAKIRKYKKIGIMFKSCVTTTKEVINNEKEKTS